MRRPWDAIVWWEIRRIPFNLIVLVVGFASGLVIELIGSRLVKPGEDVEEPIGIMIAIIGYGVAANLCYTLGWITEIVWSGGDTIRTEAMRPKVFRAGIIFSVVLTLLPAILIPLTWLVFGFK
jgi:hypothetical protein